MKTIKHFDYFEVDATSKFKNADWDLFNPDRYGMRINNNSPVEYIFFRSLIGGLACKYNSPYIKERNKFFLFDENLYKNPISSVKGKTLLSELYNVIYPLDFNNKSFMSYFNEQRSNSGFYINLLLEFSNAIYSMNFNHHTKAFIHIYRAYEHLAYSFPLVFVSTAKSYERSYGKLKQYFKDGGDSELQFGKQFVMDNVDSLMLDSIVQVIDKKSYLSNVVNRLSSKNAFTISPGIVSFPLKTTWDMVVEIRNRFFHNLTGMGNSFDSQLIIDSDEFFRLINKPSLILLSSIYFSILTKKL
ncbi:hypothetical protein ACI51Z_13445 [Pectobacterium carotovorum]|uniref:hypothetical protein n=1 Tax=Pectobacterium TaxID=122277 RepID=UPI00057E2CA2|nr:MULTISPECIES: hypothetical protein [Pectobacterium]KHS99960.1 hypothetical protein RC88_01475 [Pectobacterium parvum]